MAAYDKVVSSAAENLFGDERLRSNLTDEVAKVAMDWALARVQAQASSAKDEATAKQNVQTELARVRPVLVAVNQVFARQAAPNVADVVAALRPLLQSNRAFALSDIVGFATALASAATPLRSKPASR